ncbi:penicillin-binding protein [Candidatus Shapirobacteria bacterium CG08_land_8_20_14_0_20_39_18]|uniref:Penicillin-binding protein n=1 Tax=Candidatus Shapirobacteria bacterium CG08_land_8_20_14_0_20_39_18 TaxID=1974883 RepID=A0A2M6XD76_9BACT|nr:MAG: penicillin-binding protein [Candidatus Shapirobacteria bacterium CG08_land_8_20_14_0_20_39_18]PIY66135.1 MAG: penicillin-binding protein [Candidatus Shapirobacteria bacterium CG_4_10_14_0_8_um_filter_39_15]
MFWKRFWKNKRREINFARSTRPKISRTQRLAKLAPWFFGCLLLGTIVSALVFALYARELPSPDKVVRREGFATQIMDRKGKLLYEVFENQRRNPVDLNQIPTYLRQATVAIEDKDFYKHSGFDPKGWLRIPYYFITTHQLSGGSTLTQQLVKNVLLTSEKTINRKIKEFILALEIERKYSKDQILQMYLNEAPYGGTAWGVQAAAQVYFNKDVSELNLAESAFMAGLTQRPSYYSPYSSAGDKAYIWRTKAVLRRMREDGYITKDLEVEAGKQVDNMQFTSEGTNFKAPHFVMYVKQLLIDKYGENMVEQGGLKVTTSLDLDLQNEAQKIVSEEITKTESLHITNGAAMVLNTKTGEILVMVGSKDYSASNYDGKVNVTLSKRQPGSAIKPATYVTAFKKGYTPSTLLMDVKTSFPGGDKPEYVPVNYDGKDHGPIQVRYALGNSFNIPAVKMLARVGLKDMLQTAWDMGFTTLEPTTDNMSKFGLSMTLGGGEVRLIDMVSAYSAFANGGNKIDPVAILKVADNSNNVLYEYKQTIGKQVISPQQAYLISNILSDNSARTVTFGDHSSIYISDRPVAVKTGTTNDKRDNWTVGWTPSIIAGVWVGNNDNSQMKQLVSGISGAAPIWRRIILKALENKPKEDFVVPENIVTAEVDLVSGYRAHDNFPSRIESFIKGTEPVGDDPVHVLLKTCKSSGKLATPVDISRGDYDQKEYFILKEDDPTAGPNDPNQWQKGINDWLLTQPDTRYHPPTDYCDTNNQTDLKFTDPGDHAQVSQSFRVGLSVVSANEISLIELLVDGSSRAMINGKPYEFNLTLPDGSHTLRARVRDSKGNVTESEIKIGVNVAWDWQPTPTPTLTLTPTP